jgi:alpha-glucosidase (family GH31 glycosyl hydrolase)
VVRLQNAFPDPKGLSDELHSKGFKGIWMLDPGLKAEEGYFAYDTGCENDVWIQTADGKPYVGMYDFHGCRLNKVNRCLFLKFLCACKVALCF